VSQVRGPFLPIDRPRVEARHTDGGWRPGRLHGWVRRDGGWWAVVTYSTSPGIVFYACVPAASVRRPGGAGGTGPGGDPAVHPDGAAAGPGQDRTDPYDTPDQDGPRGTREPPTGPPVRPW
jgi:hypothetical protein